MRDTGEELAASGLSRNKPRNHCGVGQSSCIKDNREDVIAIVMMTRNAVVATTTTTTKNIIIINKSSAG